MEQSPQKNTGFKSEWVDYFQNGESVQIVENFLKEFPKLPKNSREALSFIRETLINLGFEYNNKVYGLEDVISQKKGNCLGLSILFGTILQDQGFNVSYEIAVNPKDAHYKNDIEQFDKAIHGDLFSYNQLPDLPNEKAPEPQGWFTPLEHPILIVDGVYYETTSLIDDNNLDGTHSYESESRRPATYRNLLGSSISAKAIEELPNEGGDISRGLELVKKGLQFWPNDRQSWLLLYDLAEHNFDDELHEAAKKQFVSIDGNDSLYNFSLYQITDDEQYLDQALKQYPAFISAFIKKRIKLPLKSEQEKREAMFDFTVASICVANSIEIDLESFYLSHINTIAAIFGSEYASDLLYDLEIDNTLPINYFLAMYEITKKATFLIQAFEAGIIEKSTPLDLLRFCIEVVKNKDILDQNIISVCKDKIEEIKRKHIGSKLLDIELRKLGI